jgi:hypothetical protein
MRTKNYIFSYITLSILLIFAPTLPGQSLPGEKIKKVIQWVGNHPQLPEIKQGKEYYNQNIYSGNKNNLFFHAEEKEGIVTQETLSIQDKKINFTGKNWPAVQMISKIYGSKIARDFRNSRYITTVSEDKYHKGKLFAYITRSYQGSKVFNLIELKNLKSEIDHAKYCRDHTSNCDI